MLHAAVAKQQLPLHAARCMLQTCIIKFSCSFAVIQQQQQKEEKQTNPAAQVVQGSKLNGAKRSPRETSTNMMALALDDVGLLLLPPACPLRLPCQSQFQLPKLSSDRRIRVPRWHGLALVLAKICCLLFAMRIVQGRVG